MQKKHQILAYVKTFHYLCSRKLKDKKRWHSFYYVHFKKSQQDVDQDSQQTADELNGGKGQRITGTGQMIRQIKEPSPVF